MVDVGRREDRFLDHINAINGRIKMVKVRIAMFRESALTDGETVILNAISALLEEEDDANL